MQHRRPLPFMLAVCLAVAGTAQAQYSLQTGSGLQYRIGDGLPVPIFKTGASTTGTVFPPLLIPPAPGATAMQTAGPAPRQITLSPGAFARTPAAPSTLGVASSNPAVFQVRTRLSFSFPGAAGGPAVLNAGGRTGAATTTFPGTPAGHTVRYSKTVSQFGGPAQSRLVPLSPVRVWLNAGGLVPPCKHPALGGLDGGCLAAVVEPAPGSAAAPGAAVGFVTSTPGSPKSPPNLYAVYANPMGTIQSSTPVGTAPATNAATSFGFPWTTGRITFSAPSALGHAEIFTLTGSDARTVSGAGTISLVSGALSNRSFSGPNANPGWLRLALPEPGAWAGTAAALTALGLCHRLLRRRSGGLVKLPG